IMALTAGSSGWAVFSGPDGQKKYFTEIFLRGGAAVRNFPDCQPGEQVLLLRESDLQEVTALLRAADMATAHKLDLHNISEAKVVFLLARAGLILDGYKTDA